MAGSADAKSEPAAPTPVRCEAVAEQTLETDVRLRGVVAAPPNEDAVIASAVPGRITSMRVVEGDAVSKGDLLAVVDNPALGSDRASATAAATSARAMLDSARQALERARGLFDQGIAARRELEDAEARVASAEADLTAAEAQQRQAAQQSALAQVRAPIDGVVVRVTRGIGELVDGTPATPIVEVANTTVLELACDVASADLVRIDEGQSAAVQLDALPREAISGTIARIAPTIDPSTSLGRVRIALSPAQALAKHVHIGMGGEATVTTGRHRAVVVPPSALRRSQDGHDEVVVCARREGKTVASATPVTVGARGDTWIELTHGPAAGTQVVVDRALGLQDDTVIAPLTPDAPGEPAR